MVAKHHYNQEDFFTSATPESQPQTHHRPSASESSLPARLSELPQQPYREAMRVAPEQVQAFVLGICRRQQEEKGLNRQQRRQRAKGQDR